MVQRLRCFVWTLNNYTAIEETALAGRDEFSYICWGREVGHQGTPHLQGYAELCTQTSFGNVRALLHDRAHIEPRMGTQAQAIAYCQKDGDFYEFGVRRQSGARVDLADVKTDIDEGSTEIQLWEDHFATMVRYHRSFTRYARLRDVQRDSSVAPDVRFYWGDTGTGKTRSAFEQFPTIKMHLHGKWFDSFRSAGPYLFDDLDDTEFGLPYLLRLLDRYPMDVEIKGGSVSFNPSVIIVTSNVALCEWYPLAPLSRRAALRRRFSRVLQFF